MRLSHVLRPLALALLTIAAAATASAQTVSVSGRIQPLAVPPACAPQATHVLADTPVHLFSSTLDLSAVSTIPQLFTGTDVSAGCPLIDVASVGPAPYQLFPCNTTGLGCTFTLDQCPSPTAGLFVIRGSLSSSYVPISPAAGTILINPFSSFPVASGASTAVCQSTTLTLAGPPSLIGVKVHVQAASVDPQGALLFSTLAAITIEPAGGCTAFVCY